MADEIWMGEATDPHFGFAMDQTAVSDLGEMARDLQAGSSPQ